MQRKSKPRPNRQRTEATRSALIAAARTLFVEQGYAGTSTPDIVAAAGMTRGALYHHFTDKQDLFRAVVEAEAEAVADRIVASSPGHASAIEALLKGSEAYLDAMTVPGRTRLLLVEAPAVLGVDLTRIDEQNAAATLREGLEAVIGEGGLAEGSTAALAALLSAAFDRAALAIESGGNPSEYRATMIALIERAVGRGPS